MKRKKSPNPYTELVGVRYTPEQRQELEEQAKPIPLSTYLRQLSLNRSRSKSIPAINLETYHEIQQINASLSVIRDSMTAIAQNNSPQLDSKLQECSSALQEIQAELKKIGLSAIGANSVLIETHETDQGEFTL